MRNDFCSNYLEHSAKGTTWKKGTGYLKKIPLGNGRYRYIYNQSELSTLNKASKQPINAMSNKKRNEVKKQVLTTSSNAMNTLVKSGMKAKGNTTAEKTANLKKSIANGEKIINSKLNGASKSSKKGSGGSSKSSKEKNIGKAKGSSGSKSSKEKASKEKSAKEKAAKAEKTTKNTTAKKERNTTPINMDTLKKVYGLKDEDVNSFSGSVSEFKSNMLSKYDEGSFGYLTAGDSTYKWTISGGKLVIKDYNSDKEVSADEYMKDVKEFKEFQSNKKKKK
jgi:predicted transcriptional regulator